VAREADRVGGATVGKREFETDGRDAPGLIGFPRGVAQRVSPPLATDLGWISPWILLIQASECLFSDSPLFQKTNLSSLHIHVAT
jgi:hypothetical protein